MSSSPTFNCVRLFSRWILQSTSHRINDVAAAASRPLVIVRTASSFPFSPKQPTATDSPIADSTSAITMTPPPAYPYFPERHLPFLQSNETPIKCWLETLKRRVSAEDDAAPTSSSSSSLSERVGLIQLHPHIFAYSVRTDLLWENVKWQKTYRQVNWEHEEDRFERKGGGHKPWPQKGGGRARHSSIRAPQWKGGGKVFGKRAPTSFYYELPIEDRINGLRGVLTFKYLQGDLHIVDNLDLQTDNPADLEALAVERGWGVSCLMIHEDDRIPANLAVATSQLCNFNVMPAYGFNVYSALKHDTLVLSMSAVDILESKLLTALYANDIVYPRDPPMAWPDPAIKGQFKFKTFEDQDWDIDEQYLKMPFTPKDDGHIDVEVGEGKEKRTKRVLDPLPPSHPNVKWHRVGDDGRWVYQYEDVESEQN